MIFFIKILLLFLDCMIVDCHFSNIRPPTTIKTEEKPFPFYHMNQHLSVPLGNNLN